MDAVLVRIRSRGPLAAIVLGLSITACKTPGPPGDAPSSVPAAATTTPTAAGSATITTPTAVPPRQEPGIAVSSLSADGTFAPVPGFADAPERIRSRSRTPGFHIVRPPKNKATTRDRLSQIFSTPEAAKRFKTTGLADEPDADSCFTHVRPVDAKRFEGKGWPTDARTADYVPVRHSWGGRMVATHVERLRDRGDGLRMESTDVWLDVNTEGTRHITDSAIALEALPDAPEGFGLYAGRDGDMVHVVLRSEPERLPLLFVNDADDLGLSDCGYLRISLSVPAPGIEGDVSTVMLPDPWDPHNPGPALLEFWIEVTDAGAYLRYHAP